MNKMLFVVMILSLVVVLPAFGPKCPGGLCPPPTKPPPIETQPPEKTEPPEVTEPPEETSPPPIETNPPVETQPPHTIPTERSRPNPEVVVTPQPPGGSKSDGKVITLPKSGYGPDEQQNKDVLGYILIVAVLGLTVIILGGMIRKKPND
jgi:hypothetical protein